MINLNNTFKNLIKFFIINFLCINVIQVYANEQDLYPISLSQKVQDSEFIFFGKVIDKESYKDEEGLIYTLNKVAILQSYKGENISNSILIRTVGGTVGNENLTTSCLLSLELNDQGVFFCNELDPSKMSVFASKQGFIKYDNITRQVGCPFYKTIWSNFQEEISALLGKNKMSIPNPIPQYIFPIGTNQIYIHPTVITAGTGSVLTIYGRDFGNVLPSAQSYVEFASADDGGSPFFYAPPIQNYISWSDTIIKVIVPPKAGTGWVSVYNDSLIGYSNEHLIIPFALTNVGDTLQKRLIDLNGTGGHTWSFHTSMFGGPESLAFERAVNTWKCGAGINYEINTSSVSTNSASNNGINTIFYATLSSGVLGVCYSWASTCNGSDYSVVDSDIAFSNNANWAYGPSAPGGSQFDFESVALHEIGHAHCLGHVIEAENPMEYSISNGESSRTLLPSNIFATQYMLNRSQTTSTCGGNAHQQVFPTSCTDPIKTDAWLTRLTYYLNDSTCYDSQDVPVQIGNYGVDTITTIDLGWSVNGVLQGSVSYNTNLGLNQLDTFILGNYNFQDSLYDVTVWVNNINGLQELERTNDTISYSFHPLSCFPDDASMEIVTEFAPFRCYGNDSLYINLINKGTNVLTSCKVYAELNGVLIDSLLWSGLISPRDTLFNLLLVEFQNINPNNLNEVKVWTAYPNTLQDNYTYNDTSIYNFHAGSIMGHYTVGGANPDFVDLANAFDTIQQFGICGDIILDIRDGVYSNLNYIFPLPGNSDDFSILIKSEANNANNVSITSVSKIFRGIQNVTIKHLSFDTCWIKIEDGSSNFTIDSCLFNQSSFQVGNNHNNLTADNITFTNNKVSNGQITTHTQNYDSTANYILIEGNEIDPQAGQSAIKIEYYQKVECRNNLILNSHPGPSDLIDLLFNKDTVIVTGNKIYNSNRYKTMKLWGSGSGLVVLVYNNEFSSKNTINFSYNQVITAAGINRFEVYNNSFDFYNAYNNNTNSIITFGSIDSSFLKNNNYRVDGTGYVYYFQNYGNYFESDFNSFWSSYDISKENTLIQSTFQDYSSYYNVDLNSHELDPEYFSPTFLKPTIINLNDQGVSLPVVNTDIDGVLRGSPPDIGAYEFDALNYDIKINDYLNVRDSSFCPGDSSEVIISLYNNGLLPIDSFEVYLSFNNEPYDTLTKHFNILPGDTAYCSLGIHYFYKPYSNAVIICDLPNGTVDTSFNNNVREWTLYTKLDGVYTVGDSISDFENLQHAFQVLNLGMCGPVTFNIKPGIHSDPGELGIIDGNDVQNQITIQSVSSDTSDTYIVNNSDQFYLNGVKFLSFNNLSFEGDIVIDSIQGGFFDTCSFNNVQFISTESIESEFIDSLNIRNSLFQNSVIEFTEYIDIRGVEIAYNSFTGNSAVYFEGSTNTIQSLHFENIDFHHNEVNVFLTLNPLQEFIFLQGVDGFSIHENNIKCPTRSVVNLKHNRYGENRIFNNFIQSKWHPFLAQGNTNLFIDHNTLYSRGVNFYSNPSVIFRNNIMYFNPFNNLHLEEYFYYFNFTNTYGLDDLTADGNLFYGDVTQFVYEVGQSVLSLSDWRSIYQSDLNSVVGDPYFIGPNDLHVNSQLADNSGIDLNTMYLDQDIDGDIRSINTPDIGADEFTYDPNLNLGIQIDSLLQPVVSCQIQDTVIASVTNLYVDTVFNLNLKLFVDGVLIDSLNLNDTLLYNQTKQLYFGQYNFLLDSSYQIDLEANIIDNPFSNLNGSLSILYSSPEEVQIVFGSDFICGMDSTYLTTNWTGSQNSISWSIGANTDTIWVDSSGIFGVEGISVNGCISNDTIEIFSYPVLIPFMLDYSDTITCEGGIIQVGVLPDLQSNSYQWNWTVDDTSIVYINDSTMLSVEITDSNGCIQILNQNFYVNDNPDFTVVLVNDSTLAIVSSDQNHDNYQWYLDGNSILNANDSIFIVAQNGTYTVEVTNTEGCSLVSDPIIIQNVGITEEGTNRVKIYPNPVIDKLQFEFQRMNGLKIVKIYDIKGKLIVQKEISSKIGLIDVGHLAKGLYQIQISNETNVYNYRFVKE